MSPEVGFVTEVTAFVGTTDGGASFQPLVEPPGTHLVTVSFSSAQTGYGLSTDGTLWSTTNGGRAWSSLDPGATWVGLCFSDSRTGLLAASDGVIYDTADGGRTRAPVYQALAALGESEASLGARSKDVFSVDLHCSGARATATFAYDSDHATGYLAASTEGVGWATGRPFSQLRPDLAGAVATSIPTRHGQLLVSSTTGQGFASNLAGRDGGSWTSLPQPAASSSVPVSPGTSPSISGQTVPIDRLHIIGSTSVQDAVWFTATVQMPGVEGFTAGQVLLYASPDAGASWALVSTLTP